MGKLEESCLSLNVDSDFFSLALDYDYYDYDYLFYILYFFVCKLKYHACKHSIMLMFDFAKITFLL